MIRLDLRRISVGRRAGSAAVAAALCVGTLLALPVAGSATAAPVTVPARTLGAEAAAAASAKARVKAVPAAPAALLAAQPAPAAKPTIVLVHGAFADASGWSAEIGYLTGLGYPVLAPANPLRGVASDAAYLDSVLATISGPVVLVGHSYGGAVIAAAANKAPNVKALVYISAFIPERSLPAAYYTDKANFPGSLLDPATTLLIRPVFNPTLAKDQPKPDATPSPNDSDVYIQPADFRAIFAADRSPAQATVMAAQQRPVSLAAYTERTGAAATLPSWDLVSLDDKAIPPAAQLYMAHQAGARITTIHSAHDSLITHPQAVDSLILQAARSIDGSAPAAKVLLHLSLAAGQRPENVAVEPNGDLDVSMSQAAQIVRITPAGKQTVLATLPYPADRGVGVPVIGFASSEGLVRAADGTLYVGYAAGTADLSGIWRVRPGGKPQRIIPLPANSFPNGMAIDSSGKQLYFNDSTRGLILRAPLTGGAASTWYSGPETMLTGLYGLGANGLKIHRGAVWITNFDQGTLVRIPIGHGGTAGVPQIRARVPGGPDDFTFVDNGSDTVIAGLDPGNEVVQINPDGSYRTLLTAADGLQGPTSVAIVGRKLYVFSAAYLTTTDPNVLVTTLDCH